MDEIYKHLEAIEQAVAYIIDNKGGFDPEDQDSILEQAANTLEEAVLAVGVAQSDHIEVYSAFMDDMEAGGIYG